LPATRARRSYPTPYLPARCRYALAYPSDTHEVAYVIEGTFTFERAGEAPKVMHAGYANYVAPNVVHRGMNLWGAPVKLFVVRIKPKDAPLAQDVPAPKQ
jgi:quercetin dioxygenase-like cupin family protein